MRNTRNINSTFKLSSSGSSPSLPRHAVVEMQHPSPQHRSHVASGGTEAAFNHDSDTLSSLLPRSKRNVLLSQSFSFTLKGPVYRGARLGFPSLSSRTYTESAIQRAFAMNVEDLKFVRSSARGVWVAALVLASTSCSAADRGRDCSAWKHIPGMRCGAPNTTSSVKVAVSSLVRSVDPRAPRDESAVHEQHRAEQAVRKGRHPEDAALRDGDPGRSGATGRGRSGRDQLEQREHLLLAARRKPSGQGPGMSGEGHPGDRLRERFRSPRTQIPGPPLPHRAHRHVPRSQAHQLLREHQHTRVPPDCAAMARGIAPAHAVRLASQDAVDSRGGARGGGRNRRRRSRRMGSLRRVARRPGGGGRLDSGAVVRRRAGRSLRPARGVLPPGAAR